MNELFYVVEDFVADELARVPGDAAEAELLAVARTFLTACCNPRKTIRVETRGASSPATSRAGTLAGEDEGVTCEFAAE
ncbi:hypothetical protein [Streptomyces sp. NPDC002889]|uniref:hypothetical protein n=1 Tax=Streptomyces sp. NPDC002889 TaxID=3364669 RepID=UPI00369CC963